jgi:hypothetical protein
MINVFEVKNGKLVEEPKKWLRFRGLHGKYKIEFEYSMDESDKKFDLLVKLPNNRKKTQIKAYSLLKELVETAIGKDESKIIFDSILKSKTKKEGTGKSVKYGNNSSYSRSYRELYEVNNMSISIHNREPDVLRVIENYNLRINHWSRA